MVFPARVGVQRERLGRPGKPESVYRSVFMQFHINRVLFSILRKQVRRKGFLSKSQSLIQCNRFRIIRIWIDPDFLCTVSECFFDCMGQPCCCNASSSCKSKQLYIQCGTFLLFVNLIERFPAVFPIFEYRIVIQNRSVGFNPRKPVSHFFVCFNQTVRKSDELHDVSISPKPLNIINIINSCFFYNSHLISSANPVFPVCLPIIIRQRGQALCLIHP